GERDSRRAESELALSDLRNLVRLRVRAQRDAALPGVLGRTLQVAVHHVHVNGKKRGIDWRRVGGQAVGHGVTILPPTGRSMTASTVRPADARGAMSTTASCESVNASPSCRRACDFTVT